MILEFGGNDGLRGLPVTSTRDEPRENDRSAADGEAAVLLAGMTLPRNYGPEYIHSFEQIYVGLAKQYKLARIPFLLEGVGGNPESDCSPTAFIPRRKALR